MGWVVKRRFTDFTWLRQTLLQIHPDCFIPPVPDRQYRSRITDKTLASKRRFLEYSINAMSRSPILRSSFVFQRFLKDDGAQSFTAFKKTASKIQPPHSLSGFVSQDGILRLDSQREDPYVKNLGYYLDNSEQNSEELKQQSKALIQALLGIGNLLTKMSETCTKLEAAQSVLPNLHSNTVLYSTLGSAMHNWAKSEFEQATMVGDYFSQFLTYSTAEIKPLKELLARRNECLANYLKADAKLVPKKDKLWYAGDVSRWELTAEDRALEPGYLLANKALAIRKMLPTETTAVNLLHDRFAYFNARVKVESERILWENSLIHNQHYSNFTKLKAEHTTQVHIQWSQSMAQLAHASHEALQTLPVVIA
mmetsp:Transcript_11445/g.22464  ORF Transcript_11445/g.22464 Transcript_11445/m.22464 type:complete len:366 (+) Transcript_11445:491-1588(+)